MAQETSKRDQERQMLARSDQTRHLVDWLDASEAAEALGFTEMHTKTLCRDNKLKAVKVKFYGYRKWLVDPESVENYEGRHSPTGMRRYILRIDPDVVDIQAVRQAIAELTETTNTGEDDQGESIWTLRRPKSSSKSKKDSGPPEDFTPQLLAQYSAKPPHLRNQDDK